MKHRPRRDELTPRSETELRADLDKKMTSLQAKIFQLISQAEASTQAEVSYIRDTILNEIDILIKKVDQSTEDIRDTVIQTIITLRDALNIPRHFAQNPWPSFILSIVSGTLIGSLTIKRAGNAILDRRYAPRPTSIGRYAFDTFSKSLLSLLASELLHYTAVALSKGRDPGKTADDSSSVNGSL